MSLFPKITTKTTVILSPKWNQRPREVSQHTILRRAETRSWGEWVRQGDFFSRYQKWSLCHSILDGGDRKKMVTQSWVCPLDIWWRAMWSGISLYIILWSCAPSPPQIFSIRFSQKAPAHVEQISHFIQKSSRQKDEKSIKILLYVFCLLRIKQIQETKKGTEISLSRRRLEGKGKVSKEIVKAQRVKCPFRI